VIPTGSRTCLVVRIADASDFERVPKEIVRDNKVVDLYVIVGSPVTRIGERLSMKNLSALGIVNHVLN
jgi:hypothetical protein